MSFLEQLEKKAAEQRQKEQEQQLAREEREVFFNEVADPTIRKLFEYLKKLASHLNYLGDKREIIYRLPGYGEVSGNLKELMVRFSASDEHRQIDIVGTAELPKQPELELVGDVEVKRMQTFLREHGLQGGERLRRNSKGGVVAGTYRPSGTINVRVLIHCSIAEPELRMEFTNLHDFGRLVRLIPPEHLDDDLMDKVGRFVARVDDEFLKEDLSDEIREQLRRQLDGERRQTVKELTAADHEVVEVAERERDRMRQAESLADRFKDRLEQAKRKLIDE